MSEWEMLRERAEREDGKPYRCDFQAGLLWCQSRSLTEVFWRHEGGWGWVCNECKHFHISRKQHLQNLLDMNDAPDGDRIDKP